jgi:hypothetical protein
MRKMLRYALCALVAMAATAQAGEPFLAPRDEILSTSKHEDLLTLRLFAAEQDWGAFDKFYDALVKKHQAGMLAAGTIFYIERYFDDGTVLIHKKGYADPLFISDPALPQNPNLWGEFIPVNPTPTPIPSPNPASTPI